MFAPALVLAAMVAAAACTGSRGGGQAAASATGCAGSPSPTAPSSGAAAVSVAGLLHQMKLVSYYPEDAAWTNMWTNWQPQRIDRDLCGIAGLGANTVRIIVQPQAFGFPSPAPDKVDRLSAVVGMAAAHGLRVQLTLFDWWSDYADTRGSDSWAAAILTPFRNDSRIAFCELKNEIDVGDIRALSWAGHELPEIRAALGSIPVTVSVSADSPREALNLLRARLRGAQPDFYDVHYYGPAGAAYVQLSAARAAVAPVPLLVGETGASSQAAQSPSGEAFQDLYVRSVEWAAQRAGLPDAAPWMYTDLVPAAVPSGAAVPAAQLYFGLIRANGSAKPVAGSVRTLFSGGAVPTGFGNAFASGHSGVPDGWRATAQNGTAGTGQFAWDSAVGHDAPGSARLGDTPASADPVSAFFATPVVQPTRGGETFRLTAWAKGRAATGSNRVAISWFTGDGSFVGESDSPALPLRALTWSALSVTADTPPGAAYAQVRLQSEGNRGTVWFDDVSFTAMN
jgi:hypothetical protein